MPSKASSSRARRPKAPTAQPRRNFEPAVADSATSSPSGSTRSKTSSRTTRTRSKTKQSLGRTGVTTNTPAPPVSSTSRRLQTVTSPTPRARIGLANSNTPNRPSASSRSTSLASARNSLASYAPQVETITAAPRVVTQLEMDAYIESELRNAIFHDPSFVERFLSGATNTLQVIEEHCRVNNEHYQREREWQMPERVPDEPALYEPIVNILNTIKQAVDHIHSPPPNPVVGAPEEPPQLFINNSTSAIPSDLADTAQIKPDLILFQDRHRHWENVRMPIEVKTSPKSHKLGMKQLSRYARATFAHQLHRRHLYGILFCGTQATFVRFDRAGILYSKRIDVVKEAEVFTRAFASLLMLDRVDEGYDPAFTFERDEENRLIYYIDLPESAFVKASRKSKPSGRNGRTRRFKVVEILCHRQSICGRATIVLRIRDELETEGQAPEEYALKMIWRDPERGSGGEVLGQVHGKFGLAQSIWHCDVPMPGKCQCPVSVEEWCSTCVDRTAQVEGLQVCDKLKDISIAVPPESTEEDHKTEYVDTTECHPTSHRRPLRTYSYILMESIGVPLWQAESPRQFLTAVLDAILGYWSAFNLGIMHRDISDGNVLMLDTDQEFSKRDWLKPHPADVRIQVPALIESEAKLRAILEEIGHRDPTGMLSDFDLYAMHSSADDHAAGSGSPSVAEAISPRSSRRRLEDNAPLEPRPKRHQDQVGDRTQTPSQREKRRLIDFRTGTPAFMSINVLRTKIGTAYHHHFFDDLESFFWLILWCVAAHLDEGQQHPTPDAQDFLDVLNQESLKRMSDSKRAVFDWANDPEEAEVVLASYGNEWANNPMLFKAITNMGSFLSGVFISKDRVKLGYSPGDAFVKVVKILLEALDRDD